MEAEAFLKMDIFFFVTTLVVILVGLLILPILYYIVQIVRNVRDISTTLKEETDSTVKDFREIRKEMKAGVATARRYTKAAAGAGLLKAVGATLERFVQERMSTMSDKKKSKTKQAGKKSQTKNKTKEE